LAGMRQIVGSNQHFFGALTSEMPICHSEHQRITKKS